MAIMDVVLILIISFVALLIIYWMFFFCLAAMICFLRDKKNIFVFKSTVAEKQFKNPPTQQKVNIKAILNAYMNGYVRYAQSCASKLPGFRLRNFLFRKVFKVKAHKSCMFYADVEIRSPWNVKIGNSSVGKGSILDGRYGLIIGDNVNISNNVFIWTEQHDANDPYFGGGDKNGMVAVEDYAWISSRATVLPKVKVGKGAVLASNAMATKDLEPYGIYMGLPANKRGERNQDLKYTNYTNRHIW